MPDETNARTPVRALVGKHIDRITSDGRFYSLHLVDLTKGEWTIIQVGVDDIFDGEGLRLSNEGCADD